MNEPAATVLTYVVASAVAAFAVVGDRKTLLAAPQLIAVTVVVVVPAVKVAAPVAFDRPIASS